MSTDLNSTIKNIEGLSQELNDNIQKSLIEIMNNAQIGMKGEVLKYNCGNDELNVVRSKLLQIMRNLVNHEKGLHFEATDKLCNELEQKYGFEVALHCREDLLKQLKLLFENKLTDYCYVIEAFIGRCKENNEIDLNDLFDKIGKVVPKKLSLPQEVVDLWPKHFKWCVVSLKAKDFENLIPQNFAKGIGEVIHLTDPRHPKYHKNGVNKGIKMKKIIIPLPLSIIIDFTLLGLVIYYVTTGSGGIALCISLLFHIIKNIFCTKDNEKN